MPFEKDKQSAIEGGKNSKRGDAATTVVGKNLIMNVIDSSEDKIKETLNSVYEEDKIKYMELMIKLMSFVIPKPRTVEMTVDNSNTLSDEQLERLAYMRNHPEKFNT